MKKILVVDNNAAIRDVMKMLLTHSGYDAVTTDSPIGLHTLLRKEKPEIIILDIILGHEDGRLICRDLKNNPEFEDIYIVLFSVYSDHLEDYELYQADEALDKSFEIDQLLTLLSKAGRKKELFMVA